MIRFLCFSFLALLLCCGSPERPPEEAVAEVGENQVLDITTEPVEQDQIEYTKESDPDAAKDNLAPPSPAADIAPSRNAGSLQPSRNPPTAAGGDEANKKTKSAPAPPAPTVSQVAPAKPAPPAPPVNVNTPDHSDWNALLKKHVSSKGKVNYSGFRSDLTRLNAYLDELAEAVPGQDWSRNQGLAYWINAYNAFTIKLILNNMPLKSIQEIDKPWDKKWIELAGKTYSLNGIEHDIIRPQYKEPRIHFALVCAAKSCPPLANQAYTAANLNTLLENQTTSFLNNETFNVTQEEVVRVTPLFDWYGEDFGNVRNYLNKYVEPDIPAGVKINFLDYDWSLNN